jgi:hypothetical protein
VDWKSLFFSPVLVLVLALVLVLVLVPLHSACIAHLAVHSSRGISSVSRTARPALPDENTKQHALTRRRKAPHDGHLCVMRDDARLGGWQSYTQLETAENADRASTRFSRVISKV